MSAHTLNFSGGRTHEVAAMRRDGVLVAGHFDSPDATEQVIAALGDYRAVWTTLNPLAVLPSARALNPSRLSRGARAKAQHIARRTSLLFDFDPPRPTDTMSTDAEHEAALTQARQCRAWLCSLGWPLLPLCDSGSGAHLRAYVDMDVSGENTRLVQRVLRALKQRYSFADCTASDLPRLSRYYGTMNRKSAENSPERPWRVSHVLDSGDCNAIVTHEQIEFVIAEIGLPVIEHAHTEEKPDPAKVERTIARLADYLARIGVELTDIVPLSDGRTLLRLSHCPLNHSHTGSSAGIGVSVSGRPLMMCKHTGCAMPWSEWRAAVEKKHGISMQLESRLIFSGAKKR